MAINNMVMEWLASRNTMPPIQTPIFGIATAFCSFGLTVAVGVSSRHEVESGMYVVGLNGVFFLIMMSV